MPRIAPRIPGRLAFALMASLAAVAVPSSALAVNHAPQMINTPMWWGTGTTYTIGGSPFSTSYSDPDNDPLQSITITALPSVGTLKLSGNPVTVGQVIPADNVYGLNSAPMLQLVVPSASTKGSARIEFTASDGSLSSPVSEMWVFPNDVAPVLTGTGGSVTAVRGDATPVDPGITIADDPDPALWDATVTISSGYVATQDSLQLITSNATGNIVGTWESSTGALTLTSPGHTATAAQWQAALRAVAYRPLVYALTGGSRTVSFVARDPMTSNTVTRTVTIPASNDPGPSAPVLSSTWASTPNDQSTVIGGSWLFTAYADGANIPMAAVKVTALPAAGSLTLNGTAIVANQVIPAANWLGQADPKVTYVPQAGDTAWRQVTYVASNGAQWSNASTATFRMYPNVAPAVSLAAPSLEVGTGVPTPLDPQAAITWPGSGGILSTNVEVTSGAAPADVLDAPADSADVGDIQVTRVSAVRLQLDSPGQQATPAQWQNAIRRVTVALDGTPSTPRTVTVTVYSPGGNGTATRAVSLPVAPAPSTPPPQSSPVSAVPAPLLTAVPVACRPTPLSMGRRDQLGAQGIASARCLSPRLRLTGIARASRRVCTVKDGVVQARRTGACRVQVRDGAAASTVVIQVTRN